MEKDVNSLQEDQGSNQQTTKMPCFKAKAPTSLPPYGPRIISVWGRGLTLHLSKHSNTTDLTVGFTFVQTDVNHWTGNLTRLSIGPKCCQSLPGSSEWFVLRNKTFKIKLFFFCFCRTTCIKTNSRLCNSFVSWAARRLRNLPSHAAWWRALFLIL